ncbi:hypothetical protein E3E31_10585 [Thermococcus sp. M39]|uniref:hypothetical protein n=1 Tax=unclassified Thermococcus TaxID=2627626 RepID=UPI00143AD309|nr:MULTISPECIES: hypothetical protein [unclassified Thermococcus]NJE08960.1 hypothetical protein [Thermococcus sp. M39]NJE12766.1 hypothetical protein [Thermococcus sp. LS2]
MKRGQILSLDALLSLVIVIMVIGVVINANDMIKAEITNLVEWYDRANIANNMLDILTKSPGYPKDWEESVTTVKVVGLRSTEYSHALDYDKLMKLNSSINNVVNIKNSLVNLSEWKDFQLEFYLTTKNVSVSGSFPEIINVVLESSSGSGGVNLKIEGENGRAFNVRWVILNKEGGVYENEDICTLVQGAKVDLAVGDILSFETNETIYVSAIRQGVQASYNLPPGTIVTIEILNVNIGQGSNIEMNYGGGSCPYEFKVVGQGNVRVKFQAESSGDLSISSKFIYPTNSSEPTFSFAIINGTVINDTDTIIESKKASPWIEYQERSFVVAKLIYNKTLEIMQNQKKELIVGKLKQSVPSYAYLEIEVPQEAGNVTFVVLDGEIPKGLLIKKDSSNSNVTAVLAWKEGTQNIVKSYEGNTTTIMIPWEDIFGEFNPENGAKPVEFWLYENNFSGNVILRDLGNIGLLLEPKFEPVLIKLWVWDDR